MKQKGSAFNVGSAYFPNDRIFLLAIKEAPEMGKRKCIAVHQDVTKSPQKAWHQGNAGG
jgi:hypothetical protein